VADYALSNSADRDLTDIYIYSFRTFGEAQADAYLLGLADCLQVLADNPRMGRQAYIRPDLLCYRYGRHLIFYVSEEKDIFIVRVLHDSMDFLRHLPTEEDGR
jgi:toxin ParE1/3/4